MREYTEVLFLSLRTMKNALRQASKDDPHIDKLFGEIHSVIEKIMTVIEEEFHLREFENEDDWQYSEQRNEYYVAIREHDFPPQDPTIFESPEVQYRYEVPNPFHDHTRGEKASYQVDYPSLEEAICNCRHPETETPCKHIIRVLFHLEWFPRAHQPTPCCQN